MEDNNLEKKEVQTRILKEEKNNLIATEEEFFSVLRSIAPGTSLRTGLDGALRTGKGALIVVENDALFSLLDGGFRINTKFTPQKLIELSKMDGAIILSKDLKRINYANVLLTPDSSIKTNETGTRHKAAERTAKQALSLAIAISERKNEITLYYKNIRYPLVRSEELLRKANEQIYLIEKQRELFDKAVERLTKQELRNSLNLKLAVNAIQKGRLILKIAEELKKYSLELGKESTLLKIRLKEITIGVEKEVDLIIKDYTKLDLKKSKNLLNALSYEEILDENNIIGILNYETPNIIDLIKGWRILSKTSLTEHEISLLVKETGSLINALYSGEEVYKKIFDEKKAELVKEEIERIKSNF